MENTYPSLLYYFQYLNENLNSTLYEYYKEPSSVGVELPNLQLVSQLSTNDIIDYNDIICSLIIAMQRIIKIKKKNYVS